MNCPGDMACACAVPDFTNAVGGCVRDTCNDGVVVIEDVVAAITGETEGLCAGMYTPRLPGPCITASLYCISYSAVG